MNKVSLPLLNSLLEVQFDFRCTTYEEVNLRLGREYVRRAALWAQALHCEDRFPFFGTVQRLAPTFELSAEVSTILSAHLQGAGAVGGRMQFLLREAVCWEVYQQTATPDLGGLPNLYAPVIAMYQRHGELTAEHHLIQTPILGFAKQPLHYYLTITPYMTDEEITSLPQPEKKQAGLRFTYTKGWSRTYKRHLALWEPKQARAAHESGEAYTVLVGDNLQHPQAFLEIVMKTGFVGVNFLDEQSRPYLEYKFTKKGERYFLQQTRQRKYQRSSEKVIYMETFNFTVEGQVTIYENDVVAGQTTTKEATQLVDVSHNWEDDFAFGDYTGFLRLER